MNRAKKFIFWFSCLLCGRIYPFSNIHKELSLMLQKIPNVSCHPHSVKMTTEYNHTFRINPPYSSPFFSQLPVLNLMTKAETVNFFKKNKKSNIQGSIPHASTQTSSSLSFFLPRHACIHLQKLRLCPSIQDLSLKLIIQINWQVLRNKTKS